MFNVVEYVKNHYHNEMELTDEEIVWKRLSEPTPRVRYVDVTDLTKSQAQQVINHIRSKYVR